MRDARKLPAEVLEELRRRAVEAVESGMGQAHVAQAMGLSKQAVSDWVKAYHRHGEEALRPKRRGRRPGEQRALAPSQQAEIVDVIRAGCPNDFALPYFLWTREAVGDLIIQRFKVSLSKTSVSNYLRRWGFTPSHPLWQALDRNPDTVNPWLENEYQAIVAAARSTGGTILWVDQMYLRTKHAGYQVQSQHETNGERAGFGAETPSKSRILAAVTNKHRVFFAVHAGPLDAKPFCEFLDRLADEAKRKVFVITKQHLIQHLGTPTAVMKALNERVAMYLLPAEPDPRFDRVQRTFFGE